MYARNWDDFLQRDCKAFTFPRALAIWAAASLGFATGKGGISLLFHYLI